MSADVRKFRVFLCHASQDKLTVRQLYQRLSLESWIDPWLDEEKLIPGIQWGMQIEKAVESTDAVIVCLSNHSVAKDGYVQKEMKVALDYSLYKPEGRIFIIPLRLDDCTIPWSIKSIQYIDYFPLEQAELAYKKLLRSLETQANALNLDITEIKSHFQAEEEKKVQRELFERINREAKEKIRSEEEKILRQEAEQRARSEIIEEMGKLVKEGKRKEAEEKARRENELIQQKTEELYRHEIELLRRKRLEEQEEQKQTGYNSYNPTSTHISEPRRNAILIIISVTLCGCCALLAVFWWLWSNLDALMSALMGAISALA